MQRGEIGALFDGDKQVVGFKNWTIDFRVEATGIGSPWRQYRPVMWRATTDKFWLVAQPSTEAFTGKFYSLVNRRLVLMCEKKVTARFTQEHPLNQTINAHLEMVGNVC